MWAMTVVLVHGNPETDAFWDPLVEVLGGEDVIRLSPPGFGAPLPDGWPATYLDYRDWLEGELTRFDGPGGPGRARLGRRPRAERGEASPEAGPQLRPPRYRPVPPALHLPRS